MIGFDKMIAIYTQLPGTDGWRMTLCPIASWKHRDESVTVRILKEDVPAGFIRPDVFDGSDGTWTVRKGDIALLVTGIANPPADLSDALDRWEQGAVSKVHWEAYDSALLPHLRFDVRLK